MTEQLDFLKYPVLPGHKGGETSAQAAVEMAPTAGRVRTMVIEALHLYGDATPDEVAQRLGLSILTVRPRFSELKAQGRIVDTGRRHRNVSGKAAKVWRLSKLT